jgi:hypothetical protein
LVIPIAVTARAPSYEFKVSDSLIFDFVELTIAQATLTWPLWHSLVA